MSVEILTVLFFGSLLLFLLLGAPLAFVLGGVSVIFLNFEMGPLGFYLLASKMWETMQSPTLMAVPLFVFMAILLEKSGVANDLYDMMHQWWGGLRGGLAIGTIALMVVISAMNGLSVARMAIAHPDVEDRLGVVGYLPPKPQRLEHPPRPGRQGIPAPVEIRPAVDGLGRRVDQRGP